MFFFAGGGVLGGQTFFMLKFFVCVIRALSCSSGIVDGFVWEGHLVCLVYLPGPPLSTQWGGAIQEIQMVDAHLTDAAWRMVGERGTMKKGMNS